MAAKPVADMANAAGTATSVQQPTTLLNVSSLVSVNSQFFVVVIIKFKRQGDTNRETY